MKQIGITLILALLLCVPAYSQDKLASLPEHQRDSVLVGIAQNLLKEKYPKWYRKNVTPQITKREYVDIERSRRLHNLPKDVKMGDIFYRVTLYYPDYSKEKFEYDYTGDVFILGKTLQPYYIHLGAVNIGYNLFPKEPNVKK